MPAEETCGRCLYFFLVDVKLRGRVATMGLCRWTKEERTRNLDSDACEAYRPVALDLAARYLSGAESSAVAVGEESGW